MERADRAFEPLHLLPLTLEDAPERLIEPDAPADGTPGFPRIRDRVQHRHDGEPMATSATSVRVEGESTRAARKGESVIYVGFRGKPEYTPLVRADRRDDQ